MTWIWSAVIALSIILVLFMFRFFMAPIRMVFRLLVNSVVGLALLWFVNFVGNYVGVHVGINPVTILIAGFLGVPGVVVLLVLQYVMRYIG